MPFKANASRRHHIPKQKRKVTNWAAYDASLRQRGSLTIWFTDEAITAWQAATRTTRGGQPSYSPLAILTALTLRAVFRLALRQTEGLIGSIIRLLGLTLAVPDHSTLSRRAGRLEVPQARSGASIGAQPLHLLVDSTGLKLCGAVEWLVEKHGTKTGSVATFGGLPQTVWLLWRSAGPRRITCPDSNAGALMSDENQLRLGARAGPTDLGR
jgi:Transposase DDE domain